jgi:hypothetical protein
MSQPLSNNLRRSNRSRFAPVFLAEEQSQDITFASLQSTFFTAASNADTTCSRYEGVTFGLPPERKFHYIFLLFALSLLPLQYVYVMFPFFSLVSRPKEELVNGKRKEKRKKQVSTSKNCPNDQSNYEEGFPTVSKPQKEYSKKKSYSLTAQPKNAAKLHGLVSKTAETDEANGTTSTDPKRIPKHTNELDVPGLKECASSSIHSR